MDGNRNGRPRMKAVNSPHWKEKLRENCLRRVREDRAHLLWKIRLSESQEPDPKETVESAFKGIVAAELNKIKKSTLNDRTEILASDYDDLLWEYNDRQMDYSSAESNYEELLIEMESFLYEDMKEELIRKELEVYEEEDEYLAKAVFEHMQLNDGETEKRDTIWCPVCKRGELREAHHLICCTGCNLHLDLGDDKVNLDFLRNRLGEVHEEHLDKGCRATPSFFLETGFGLTALYIRCQACGTFEIVV
ncbi:unnamed protein product [Spirodela intermedia]|uniref:Uncharacterized protein n=1 Tax=Spirodela intermedia TaxID=51605 RepID=A0A7I8IRT9_SPIIN|nr:unnamed protein product [Spirodela intermedia]CAA6660266.1 unnamed protein product [Spirodela intermedia]